MSWTIWYHLACNFTKSNTLSWVFFMFFKLYQRYQIAQRTTNNDAQKNLQVVPRNCPVSLTSASVHLLFQTFFAFLTNSFAIFTSMFLTAPNFPAAILAKVKIHFRNSYPKRSIKKLFRKIYTKTSAMKSYFQESNRPEFSLLLKMELCGRCFPVNFTKRSILNVGQGSQ